MFLIEDTQITVCVMYIFIQCYRVHNGKLQLEISSLSRCLKVHNIVKSIGLK